MKTLAQATNGVPLDYSDEQPDGSKYVYAIIDGVYQPVGILLPTVSARTLEASPGIQAWSNPRGKVASVQYDRGSVASFAAHWERKWRKSYPFAS